MAKQVPARNGGTLTRPDKGESMNPNGRPRKWVSSLKHSGYRQSEINDCLRLMLSMTLDELQSVFMSPDSTVLEKTVASAIRNGIKKGTLDQLETLLSRMYGKPIAKQEIAGAGGEPLFPVQFVVKDDATMNNLRKLSDGNNAETT